MKKACITGVTGQTGSYMCELLLSKGYEVYGLNRRTSNFNTQRIDHLYIDPHEKSNLKLVYGDLSDGGSITNFVSDIKPDLFFNLGAQSHVLVSSSMPEFTFDVNATGVLRVLEAIRKNSPKTKILQASTSEMFGGMNDFQNINTPFHPRSPYGVSKVSSHYLVQNYRESYDMFACSSITYNHESPRRGPTFITRKITMGAARCKLGLQKKIYIGNLEAKRDWCHAKDVVEGMYLMLNADNPKDYIMATGKTHSVQQLVEFVFSELNMDWKEYVELDEKYLRPAEVNVLCGDSTPIREELGWEPKYSFETLIKEMIAYDLELAKKELPAI